MTVEEPIDPAELEAVAHLFEKPDLSELDCGACPEGEECSFCLADPENAPCPICQHVIDTRPVGEARAEETQP